MSVIVTSDLYDTHADAVIDKLIKKSVEVYRIDPFDANLRIGYFSGSSAFELNGLKVNHKDVTGVYCRSPLDSLEISSSDPVTRFSFQEHVGAISGVLLQINHKLWINSPWIDSKVDIKIYSLGIAISLGIDVPQIKVGSPSWIRSLGSKIEKSQQVIKQITDSPIALQDNSYSDEITFNEFAAPYTANFNYQSLFDTEDETPILIQDKIKVKINIRIVNIDNNIFATELLQDQMVTDSRLMSRSNEQFCIVESCFGEKIKNLQKKLGLRLATYDILVDEENMHWLVDINPSGNWLWQDIMMDGNISNKISQALANSQ